MLVCDWVYFYMPWSWVFVSILVLVDVGLRLNALGVAKCYRTGFNPCFSGCWSAIDRFCRCPGQKQSVSILVLVDVGLRSSRLPALVESKRVSILVLVDVGLRSPSPRTTSFNFSSFNPCFSGCWSAIGYGGTANDTIICFNPCFSGCWSAIKYLISLIMK